MSRSGPNGGNESNATDRSWKAAAMTDEHTCSARQRYVP